MKRSRRAWKPAGFQSQSTASDQSRNNPAFLNTEIALMEAAGGGAFIWRRELRKNTWRDWRLRSRAP